MFFPKEKFPVDTAVAELTIFAKLRSDRSEENIQLLWERQQVLFRTFFNVSLVTRIFIPQNFKFIGFLGPYIEGGSFVIEEYLFSAAVSLSCLSVKVCLYFYKL